MAFNGSGTFNLAAGNPVTTGTTISSTWANSTLSDVATGLTNCITRDGQSTPLANIPMGNYKLTGLGQAASTGDALAWGKNASVVDLAASGAVTLSGGTANGVGYLNASKVFTTGSALTFDGSVFAVGRSTPTSAIVSRWDNASDGNRGAAMYLSGSAGSGLAFLSTTSSGYPLAFGVDGSEQMRLTSTGLGIGTSSPSQKLEVAGNILINTSGNPYAEIKTSGSGNNPYLKLSASTNSWTFQGTFSNTNNPLIFLYNSSSLMTLDNAGNLGLGVTPSAWASGWKVIESAGANGYVIASANVNPVYLGANWYSDGTNRYKTTGSASSHEANSNGFRWYTAPSGTAGNAITFSQAMTLDSSGNFLVGTTSSYGGPGRINVGFNQSTNFGVTLRNTNASATGVFVSFENSGGGGNGSISQTNSTTVAYNTSSDRRLKKNIVPASDAGGDIDLIQIVTHGWISNEDTVKYGVIAQDLISVAPNAVRKGDDGKEISETWGVDYSKLVPMLIKEIQSLRKRIATLEAK